MKPPAAQIIGGLRRSGDALNLKELWGHCALDPKPLRFQASCLKTKPGTQVSVAIHDFWFLEAYGAVGTPDTLVDPNRRPGYISASGNSCLLD